jgi:hypothetical protein
LNKLEFDVTQEDIDKGERCNGSLCPIARAILRIPGLIITPNETWRGITVTSGGITISYEGSSKHFHQSEEGRKFVFDFDSGIPVTPCHLVAEAY